MSTLVAEKTTKRVKVTPVYDKTAASEKPVVANVGGARSSKSYSIAQLLIYKLANEHHKVFGVCRKTLPSLRMTAYKLIVDLLKDYGIYYLGEHNKAENTFQYGDNIIYFFSLDDPEKKKSTEFSYIWLEEANEFSYGDFTILKLRLSAPKLQGEINQMYLSLNPVDQNCWITKKLDGNPEVEIFHSTYHDNPFLSQEYINILENLINEDPNYYRIYCLGEWGRLENIIYSNWKIVDKMPDEWERRAYGLDFGFVNPTALGEIRVVGNDAYIDERIYQTYLTNADLIERLKAEERADIYADSAEPQRIEEICRAGFNCKPANKDVKLGIDTCKRYTLHITRNSVNIIKEIQGYQRKVNKDGVVLEDPVDFNNHAMDLMRYCMMGIAKPRVGDFVLWV